MLDKPTKAINESRSNHVAEEADTSPALQSAALEVAQPPSCTALFAICKYTTFDPASANPTIDDLLASLALAWTKGTASMLISTVAKRYLHAELIAFLYM